MALVNKQDPKKIFASQAPSQDVPAEFNNYERGWDESRKNNGKPTIKQSNKLQQLTDEKILWMHQNGAALPFDETMEYAEGAVVVKDGVLQQLKDGNWQTVKQKGVGEPYQEGATYDLGDEVRLENGDRVRSTVAGNTNDPNVDMTGWVPTNKPKNHLSYFGAVPNDPTKAVHNRTALLFATLAGPVVIDGHYFIDASTQNNLNTSLHWVAAESGGSIHFTGVVNRFISMGNVDHVIIDNDLKITADATTGTLVTIQNDLVVINLLKIKADVDASIGIFRATWSNTVDPTVTYYGVRRAIFSGSKLKNTKTAFQLVNCPSELFELNDIKAKNISYTPFSFGIDNTHLYPKKIKEMQKRFESYNIVCINDDDFWDDPTGSGAYFAFALFEGAFADIKNPHVEGLKTRAVRATYDFYLNCTDYSRIGGVWKNNICFNSSKRNNELMKAKGSYKSIHKGVRYIVEEDFILRHATDVKSQGWVTLFEKVYGADDSNAVMEDNTIDVYMLLGMSSSIPTKNVRFKRNKVKAKIAASNFLNIANTKTYDITTHADADVVIKENEIEIGQVSEIVRAGTSYTGFTLLRMVYDSSVDTYRKIESDNTIRIGNVVDGIFTAYASPVASEVILNDKIYFDGATEGNNRLFASSSPQSLVIPLDFKSKVFTRSNLFSAALAPIKDLSLPAKLDFELDFLFENLSTVLPKPLSGKKNALIEFIAEQGSDVYSAKYKLILEPDGFSYKNSADTYVKVSNPAAITSYNPQCEVVDSLHTLMTNVRFTYNPADASFITVRYEFGQSAAGAQANLKARISII